MKATPQRKLLLHFDTNKTILLADASKKYSKEILVLNCSKEMRLIVLVDGVMCWLFMG